MHVQRTYRRPDLRQKAFSAANFVIALTMPRLALVVLAVFVLIIGSSSLASVAIDYEWWKEMGQLETWFSMAAYRYLPRIAAAILAFLAFRIAFAMGRSRARAV